MLLYRYPALYDWALRRLKGPLLQRRYRVIAQAARPPGTVLDIGCGTGLLARHLAPGSRYIGIDLNGHFLARARRAGLDVRRADALQVEAYPQADHYVICDLLHHINPRHIPLLRRLVAKIKAQGKTLIVCEPFLTGKSPLKRLLIRGLLDYDFINPLRMDVCWYDEGELIQFFQEELDPDRIIRVGQDIIAIRRAR